MALNINTFVYTAGLLPGGFTGITLLIQDVFLKYLNVKIPYSLFYWLLNIIPAVVCFRFVGKKFTVLSILMIIVSGLATDFIPGLAVTDDIILCAVFGGIINGMSVFVFLQVVRAAELILFRFILQKKKAIVYGIIFLQETVFCLHCSEFFLVGTRHCTRLFFSLQRLRL